MSVFFNEFLEKKIPAITQSFSKDLDGGLNPALKILDLWTNQKNKMDAGRWEIFVLLKNEAGNLGVRSGIKCQTTEYAIKAPQEFNLSLFPPKFVADFSLLLLTYRFGHPSLALDFRALDKGNFQTLPVFGAGWLIRNDFLSQKRIQIYWSSGRYERKLSEEAMHLLQLAVAFHLISEYGKDYVIEFFPWQPYFMEKFMTGKAARGLVYDWIYLVREVRRLITEENTSHLAADFITLQRSKL